MKSTSSFWPVSNASKMAKYEACGLEDELRPFINRTCQLSVLSNTVSKLMGCLSSLMTTSLTVAGVMPCWKT